MSGPVRTACDECLDERRRIRAALEALVADMDRAGGDGYGMPECPWCMAQGSREGDDKWHASECPLLAAREALSPAAREASKPDADSTVKSFDDISGVTYNGVAMTAISRRGEPMKAIRFVLACLFSLPWTLFETFTYARERRRYRRQDRGRE
jgi:hypothetical protein